MSEFDFQSLMNCDQLELDLGIGFPEFIPDIFEEASLVPEMSADFLSYPGCHDNFNGMLLSDELKPEMCDLTNYGFPIQPEQHQNQPNNQQNWETFNVPSTPTSPVQFEGINFNSVPQGYKEPRFYETNFVNGLKRRAVNHPCDAALDFENTFQGGDKQVASKPKRKRVQNTRQRKEANVREKKRMFQLKDAFDSLKTRVPTFSDEKRLSRMETLKLAMSYISFMTQLLDGKKSDEISLRENGLNSFSLEDLGRFKSTLSSSYLSDGTGSSESGSISS